MLAATRVKLVGLGIFVLLAMAFGYYVRSFDLSIDQLMNVNPIAFIGLYILVAVFMLPASPLTLAAGALYGPIWGTIYTIVGAGTGASLAFIITRYLLRDFFQRVVSNKIKKIEKYDDWLEHKSFVGTLILRLVPLVPFNGLNQGMALTKVKTKSYIAATYLGIIPGSFAYVLVGSSLMTLNPLLISSAVAFLLIFILGINYIGKKWLKKQKEGLTPSSSEQEPEV